MSIIREFREFAARGNVIDLAVGVIIGGAFGKIVSSFVADVVMPPIGLLIGGVNFTDLKIGLKDPVLDATGKVVLEEAVSLNIGNFLQACFDFLIIAIAIFLVVKAVNRFNKKEVPPPAPPVPSTEELLLAEIRDILKNK